MRSRLPKLDIPLTWKCPAEGRHEAYSGEAMVGVVWAEVGSVRFDAAGVDMTNIRHTRGHARTVTGAKWAVQRAWASWLRRARLQPIIQATKEPGPTHSIRST